MEEVGLRHYLKFKLNVHCILSNVNECNFHTDINSMLRQNIQDILDPCLPSPYDISMTTVATNHKNIMVCFDILCAGQK